MAGTIFRVPGDDAWRMADRGGFWGRFEDAPPSIRGYFMGLELALLDAGAYFSSFRKPPPGYPFMVLGQPTAMIRQNQIYFHGHVLKVIHVGQRLEFLASRLRHLTSEATCFRALGELRGSR